MAHWRLTKMIKLSEEEVKVRHIKIKPKPLYKEVYILDGKEDGKEVWLIPGDKKNKTEFRGDGINFWLYNWEFEIIEKTELTFGCDEKEEKQDTQAGCDHLFEARCKEHLTSFCQCPQAEALSFWLSIRDENQKLKEEGAKKDKLIEALKYQIEGLKKEKELYKEKIEESKLIYDEFKYKEKMFIALIKPTTNNAS